MVIDDGSSSIDLDRLLESTEAKLTVVQSPDYLQSLKGTIGADPLRPLRQKH